MTSVFDAPIDAGEGPQFVVDQGVLRENFEKLRRAADGVPLRLASKSVRVRSILEWGLEQDGVCGLLVYSAAEALWLVENGAHDVVIAYPSVDMATMAMVAQNDTARREITFMVDLPEHLEMIGRIGRGHGCELRVSLDVDASLRIGRLSLGVHRSSVHTAEEAGEFARLASETEGVRLVGIMMYEAQVAGVADATPVHRLIKRRSVQELEVRRGAVRRAVEQYADLEFVNGGGTGSVHLTGNDAVVTDIAVGSGLFTSTFFDNYRDLTTKAAAYFVSPVVRRPSESVVVTFSGGYLASGVGNSSRMPTPVWPEGLHYFGQEGPGEVQTPLRGPGTRGLAIGDNVWFRHTKAGEACERFDTVHVVEGGRVIDTVPTYRGEGKNFG